ncbi:ATP-binding protein [Streptomyces sp. NPDC085927]|uniref:ATP-binding protein n=1 Tax=Streptomyces sp. NPDC085927 TaxID=3365738 RepID=UPI0037D82892
MAIKINESTRTLRVDGTEIEPCGLGYMYEYEDCKEINLPGLRRAIAKLEGKKIPPFDAKSTAPREGTITPEQAAELLEGTTGNLTFCMRGNVWPEFITIDVNNSGDLIASFFIPCETDDPSYATETFSPHLAIRGARLIQCKYWEDPGPKIPPGWEFEILLPHARGLLSSVRDLALVLARSAIMAPGVPIRPDFVEGLCHGGAPDSLVGLDESDWLEVKSQGYDLESIKDKIELAQDVSRFANSETGGILAIGYRTKKNREGESISKCSPIPERLAQVARYRAVIDSRVFPPIDGLKIRASPHNGGWVLTVLVPSQAEENKPFLVHGAIVGGKVEGAFISIVRRRGEASIPITGPAIHSMLAAGRSILHRKHIG